VTYIQEFQYIFWLTGALLFVENVRQSRRCAQVVLALPTHTVYLPVEEICCGVAVTFRAAVKIFHTRY
jgi:hypothetical protein